MPHRTRPHFEARVQNQKPASHRATEVHDLPREAKKRVAPRRPGWNTAPVLDPLVDMYRR